ncbi:MAG: hypothetical protein LBI45_04670 [Bacteroidales bacterium]|jgi:hypothetical protein|nr:hypothetical protein [Bacteroidales bacterium]
MKQLFFTAGALFLLMIYPLNAQVKHSHEVVLGSLQLKDKNNLGMVFSGAQLEYRYGAQWKINTHEITYQPQLGFGLAWNRGMIGGQIHIAPVNITWTMPFYEHNRHSIRGGANFITDYNYQLTQLHDGTMFYTAELGISPVIQYGYQGDNKRNNVGLQNSIFGFSSHRQGYDPYEFLFTWKEFVIYPHRDLKFGSFNRYNHTTVSFEFIPNIAKKHSIVYEFDYLGFYRGNRFYRINHNLIWRIAL